MDLKYDLLVASVNINNAEDDDEMMVEMSVIDAVVNGSEVIESESDEIVKLLDIVGENLSSVDVGFVELTVA